MAKQKPKRERVSVWVNLVPLSRIPKSYFQEHSADDGPMCDWCEAFGFDDYDHDFMDVNISKGKRIPIRRLVGECSFSASFVEQVETAATKQGVQLAQHVILLYEFDYGSLKNRITKDKYFRFLGAFEYDDEAQSVYDPYAAGGSMANAKAKAKR